MPAAGLLSRLLQTHWLRVSSSSISPLVSNMSIIRGSAASLCFLNCSNTMCRISAGVSSIMYIVLMGMTSRHCTQRHSDNNMMKRCRERSYSSTLSTKAYNMATIAAGGNVLTILR